MTLQDKYNRILEVMKPKEVNQYGEINVGDENRGDYFIKWECRIGDVLQWGGKSKEYMLTGEWGLVERIYNVRLKDKLSQTLQPTEEFRDTIDYLYNLID